MKTPEDLELLVIRLRRELAAEAVAARLVPPKAKSSGHVYELPRDDVQAAIAGRVLEPDSFATRELCGE